MAREVTAECKEGVAGAEARVGQTPDLVAQADMATVRASLEAQEELVVRRNHRQRISVQHDEEQNRIATQIAQSALTKLLKQPVAFEVAYTLRAIAISRPIQTDRGRLQEAAHLLPYIYQAYAEQGSLTAKERRLLVAELALYFRRLARYQRQQGAWWGYLHSRWQARRVQLCV